MINKILLLIFCLVMLFRADAVAAAEMIDYSIVKLRALEKTTARTMTFDARVGSTIQYGTLYIRIKSCRKAPPMENPEAASFLQIWEVDLKTKEPEWVFSGWMFASSPALSAMDHPVYDVWVLDCTLGENDKIPEEPVITEQSPPDETDVGESVVIPEVPVESPPPAENNPVGLEEEVHRNEIESEPLEPQIRP